MESLDGFDDLDNNADLFGDSPVSVGLCEEDLGSGDNRPLHVLDTSLVPKT